MKKISIFLAVFMSMLLLLCGCSGTPAGSDTEKSDVPPLVIKGEGAPVYTVVRSDTAKGEEVQAAVLMRKYLNNCGMDIKITTDWEKEPVSDYEIVVGNTLRPMGDAAVDIHELGEKGFAIKVVDARVYIVGGTGAAIYEGVEYFLTEFCGYKGNVDEASPLESLSIPGDYEFTQKQQYNITSLLVDGADMNDFRIIWDTMDDTTGRNYAKMVQEYFYKNCGIWMNVDEKKEGSGAALVLSGKSSGKSGYMGVKVQDGNLVFSMDKPANFERGWREFITATLADAKGEVKLEKSFSFESNLLRPVYYSEFGAKGDGKTNDIAAIRDAHAYANKNGLPVKADKGFTYYISAADSGAIIQTDTDWTGANFIIDDTEVGINVRSICIFNVTPSKASYTLPDTLTSVAKGQAKLDITLPETSLVVLKEAGTKRYIRYGGNANNGSDQLDILVVDKNGNVDQSAPIMWDYTDVTSITVYPMDEKVLTIKGGTFTTISNRQISTSSQCYYYGRGISIKRSNVEISGFTHYVKDEMENGSPYSGFLLVSDCANVTVKDCKFTAHKKVAQGTYDINPTRVNNLTFINCTQTDDILDNTCWGIFGSNFCKNMTLDGCSLSRFDAHQGVVNATVRNSTLGHAGMSMIGQGTILIENSTFYSNSIINLRSDYGATWEGDVIIKNCTWIPNRGKSLTTGTYSVIGGSVYNFHDFGYECHMPKNVTIEGLHLDDSAAHQVFGGVYLLGNLVSKWTTEAYEAQVAAEGYPYHRTENITISGFTSVKGSGWKLSPNMFMFRNTVVNDLDKKN